MISALTASVILGTQPSAVSTSKLQDFVFGETAVSPYTGRVYYTARTNEGLRLGPKGATPFPGGLVDWDPNTGGAITATKDSIFLEGMKKATVPQGAQLSGFSDVLNIKFQDPVGKPLYQRSSHHGVLPSAQFFHDSQGRFNYIASNESTSRITLGTWDRAVTIPYRKHKSAAILIEEQTGLIVIPSPDLTPLKPGQTAPAQTQSAPTYYHVYQNLQLLYTAKIPFPVSISSISNNGILAGGSNANSQIAVFASRDGNKEIKALELNWDTQPYVSLKDAGVYRTFTPQGDALASDAMVPIYGGILGLSTGATRVATPWSSGTVGPEINADEFKEFTLERSSDSFYFVLNGGKGRPVFYLYNGRLKKLHRHMDGSSSLLSGTRISRLEEPKLPAISPNGRYILLHAAFDLPRGTRFQPGSATLVLIDGETQKWQGIVLPSQLESLFWTPSGNLVLHTANIEGATITTVRPLDLNWNDLK